MSPKPTKFIRKFLRGANRVINPLSLERRIHRKSKLVDTLDSERVEAEKRLDIARNAKKTLFEETPRSDPMHRSLWGPRLELEENAIEREGRLFKEAKRKLRAQRAKLARLKKKQRST